MTPRTISLIIGLLAGIISSGVAQSYFKIIEFPESGYFQRMATFDNGDILISDRSGDPLDGTLLKGIYLARLNLCGDIVWSNRYYVDSPQIDIYEIAINTDNDIFVFGGAIRNGKKHIFLGKFAPDGTYLQHKILDGAPTSNFTYSMSLNTQGLLISGLFFENNNNKPYYICRFDYDLNELFSNVYSPSNGYGECIATQDGGALFSSREVITKVDDTGEIEWSKQISSFTSNQSPYIPLEVSDGFIFQSHTEGTWLYKFNHEGQLVWKTVQCPSAYYLAEIISLSNGDLLAFFNREGAPAFARFSADGELLAQYQLQVGFPLNTGFIHPVLFDDQIIHLMGNAEMNYQEEHALKDFLLQFDLQYLDESCTNWQEIDDSLPNDLSIELSDYPLSVAPAVLEEISSTPMISEVINMEILDICTISPREMVVEEEMELLCSEDWIVTVPIDSFTWNDGLTDNPRRFVLPGTYTAQSSDCRQSQTFEYTLYKEDCTCEVYIPNAFSPNFDGRNDQLSLFTDCSIESINYTVYDRWGELIFQSDIPYQWWDGTFRGVPCLTGVYVLQVKARLSDSIGFGFEYEQTQSITLLR